VVIGLFGLSRYKDCKLYGKFSNEGLQIASINPLIYFSYFEFSCVLKRISSINFGADFQPQENGYSGYDRFFNQTCFFISGTIDYVI